MVFAAAAKRLRGGGKRPPRRSYHALLGEALGMLGRRLLDAARAERARPGWTA